MDIAVLDLAFDKISPTTLASWAQDGGGAGGWVPPQETLVFDEEFVWFYVDEDSDNELEVSVKLQGDL